MKLLSEMTPGKMVLGIVLGAAAVLVLVGGMIIGPREESRSARLERFKGEAKTSMLEDCTNVVVGLRLVVGSRVDDLADNPAQWSGEATVDYVNRAGGVERTNLVFRFRQRAAYDNVSHVYAICLTKER